MPPKERPKSGERHGVWSQETTRGVTWYATVDLGTDPLTGKRKQKRVKAPSRKLLDKAIADAIAEGIPSARPGSETTVGAYLTEWLATSGTRLRPTTRKVYDERIRLFLIPQLGHIRLSEIKPVDVQRMHAAVLAAGRAPGTAAAIHAVLRSALNDAVRMGILDRNVASVVHAPRPAPPEMQVWSAEQVGKALKAAQGDRYECLWRLAMTTGMRRGELLGLRWIDVDLDNALLSIRHTLYQGKGRSWESGTPKTEKGRRSIAISPEDVAALAAHRVRQLALQLAAAEWHETGLVFTEANGKAVNANRLRERFLKLIVKAGLPVIRFHDLRHTAASLMLAAGEHPKVVQERLGHSNISITLDRYSHVAPSMQAAAAERIERLIRDAS